MGVESRGSIRCSDSQTSDTYATCFLCWVLKLELFVLKLSFISFALRLLRVRFLAAMLLGAALVTAIGSYATYQVAQSHIQNQLAERSKLLASAINHSAMIAKNDADLQHVIEEVLKDNFDIRTIAVMTKDSQKLIASASAGETAFSANGDDHLFRELAEAIRAGEFGLHAENNRDLVLIARYGTRCRLRTSMVKLVAMRQRNLIKTRCPTCSTPWAAHLRLKLATLLTATPRPAPVPTGLLKNCRNQSIAAPFCFVSTVPMSLRPCREFCGG